MSNMHKSTRLGDLLVERGAITRQQLRYAIETQQKRQLEEIHVGGTDTKMELGEILIELGFINRLQLNSGLSWQQKLRKTTMAMAFVAPLLTAACGGSASNADSTANNKLTTASSSAQTITPDPKPKPKSSSSSSSSLHSSVASLLSSATASSSSAPISVSSSASSAPVSISSSAASVSSASASSSGAATGEVDGPVVIYWSVPTFRENGDYLDITEIGGYELRYKLKSASTYNTVHIDDGFIDTYYFDYLKGEYEFEIATFDMNNLYSNFVEINPN